jgi:hypothetical protein
MQSNNSWSTVNALKHSTWNFCGQIYTRTVFLRVLWTPCVIIPPTICILFFVHLSSWQRHQTKCFTSLEVVLSQGTWSLKWLRCHQQLRFQTREFFFPVTTALALWSSQHKVYLLVLQCKSGGSSILTSHLPLLRCWMLLLVPLLVLYQWYPACTNLVIRPTTRIVYWSGIAQSV